MNQPPPPFDPPPPNPSGPGGRPVPPADDINGPTVQLTPAQLGRAVPPPARPRAPQPPPPQGAGGWSAPPLPGPGDIDGPTVQLTADQLGRPGAAGSPAKRPWVKWALIGAATVLVVVITVAAMLLIGGHGGPAGPGPASTSGAASEYASANDHDAVNIITKDPSCAPYMPIESTVTDVAKASGWVDTDPAIAASAWTPAQRQSYVTLAQALRTAADQLVPLTKTATHRVLREIYQQIIAYSRAYADAVPNYTPADQYLSGARVALMNVAHYVCRVITNNAAASRAPFVKPLSPPTVSSVSDPKTLEAFMATPDPVCGQWLTAWHKFLNDPEIASWAKLDANIGAGSWTSEQRAANDAVVAPLTRMGDTFEELANKTDNLVLRDFGQLAAQYTRAYVLALPTYTAADDSVYQVVRQAATAVADVCARKSGS